MRNLRQNRIKKMNQLVAAVKRHPQLYNTNHADFKDQGKKNFLWTSIAADLGLEDGETARSKWRNLRDSYVKHLRNSVTGNNRYKNWPWAEQMEFLKPFVVSKWPELSSNFVKAETNSEDERSFFNIESAYSLDESGPSRPKRQRTTPKNHPQPPPLTPAPYDNYFNEFLLQDSDADDLLFLSYSKTLKTFSKRRQMRVKMEISKIMLEAEMCQATEDEQLEVKLTQGDADLDSQSDFQLEEKNSSDEEQE